MKQLTTQKACRIAKQLVKTVYRGYFEHTPVQLTASVSGSRTFRRCQILTIDVKELYIKMEPVKVDIWIRKGEPHGEIISHSTHYAFLEPAFLVSAKLTSGHWSPIKSDLQVISKHEKADISTSSASNAARRFLRGITGRTDWRIRHVRQRGGRYPRFMAYTKGNEGKDAPKVYLIVKEGLQVVLVEFSATAYPSIMRGIRGQIARNERVNGAPLKRSVATAKAKALVCKALKVDRKRVKGKSWVLSADGKSITVKVYVDGALCPLLVNVIKSGDKVRAELVKPESQ